MKPLYSANQSNYIDNYAYQELEMHPIQLMENAATNITNQIKLYLNNVAPKTNKIAIFCGTGNNGGDGMAVARHLSSDYDVSVFIVGDEVKLTTENKKIEGTIRNYKTLKKLKNVEIIFVDEKKIELNYGYDVIIDAMIGVGFYGELKEPYKTLLGKINNYRSLKIAIDIPTGLDSDIGITCSDEDLQNNCFIADLTVTVGGAKIGTILSSKDTNPCGEILIAPLDIGLPPDIVSTNFLLEITDVSKLIKPRKSNTHKYHYGKVYVVGGSKSMPGAICLVSNAALKMGAGLVYLVTN